MSFHTQNNNADIVQLALKESVELREKMLGDTLLLSQIAQAADRIIIALHEGGKLLIAGNGGSAADAQHFAAELVGRFMESRLGYAAIALTTDSSMLTAWSNDVGFDSVFARQVQALGRLNDVFVGISTSGNSKNIIQAVSQAKLSGMRTICLLGRDGGALKSISETAIVIPSESTPRIQECHITIIHVLCDIVERARTEV